MGRRMGIAALIVSGGVLVSRLLGQAREVIFAALLGADATTDQYVAAFALPDFLNYLLAGGFLAITFIPIFSPYLARGDEEGGWIALSAILRPIALGIVGLVAVGWLAAPTVIERLFPNFTAAETAATVRYTRIVLPAQVFFVLGGLFTAVQYAKGVFTIPTLAPVIYNLGIILGGVGYAVATGDPDPEGFVWGALVGAFAGNFALQWWGAHRVGMRLVTGAGWRHPALREYLVIAVPLMIGQSIVVLDETFMRVFGNLVGDGVQTQLQYARRTMLVPVGVIAQAAGVAAYPFLANLFAEGRREAMAAAVDRALKYVLVISLGAGALVAATTVPAIRLLFQRAAFDASDTMASAEALFFYAFAIPVWGALQVLTRAFYARRDMWTPVVVGSIASVAAVPLYLLLQRGFGLRGVALASTLALAGYTAALAVRWYATDEARRRARRMLEPTLRAVPLAVAGGVIAALVATGVELAWGTGFLATTVAVVTAVGAFGAAALLAGGALGSIWRAARTPNQAPPSVEGDQAGG